MLKPTEMLIAPQVPFSHGSILGRIDFKTTSSPHDLRIPGCRQTVEHWRKMHHPLTYRGFSLVLASTEGAMSLSLK
jgi:hypothetical protein